MSFWGQVAAGAASSLAGGLFGGGKSKGGSTRAVRRRPYSMVGGLFDGTGYQGRKVRLEMDPRLQALQDNSLSTAGLFTGLVPGFDQYQQVGQDSLDDYQGFDLDPWARDAYSGVADILGQQQDEARLGLENRLFAQGRLGSTGMGSGNDLQAQLEGELDAQRRMAFMDFYGMGMDRQNQLYNHMSGAGQLPFQLQSLFQGVGGEATQNAFGIQRAQLDALAAANNASAPTGHGVTPYSQGDYMSAALTGAGAQMIGDGVRGLFTGGGGGGYDPAWSNNSLTSSPFTVGG